MSNNCLLIVALLGVTFLVMLTEAVLSGTWNKWYFTTGLLIFQRRIPVEPSHYSIPPCAQLETHFHSEWRRSLAFRQIAANMYGFREKLFEFRLTRGSQVMHGMLFFDSENREVVVKGFSDWLIVWLPLLGFGGFAIQVVSVQGLAPLSAMAMLGVGILVFAVVLGLLFRAQYSRFSNVAAFAAHMWAGGYSEDADEA